MSLRSLAGGGDPIEGGTSTASHARAGSYTRDSDLSRLLGIAPGKSPGVRILRGGTRQIRAVQGPLQ